MFPGRYSQIFGIGERLGCILNLGHSLTLSGRIFNFARDLDTLGDYAGASLGHARARRVAPSLCRLTACNCASLQVKSLLQQQTRIACSQKALNPASPR